jgi:uncharacterized protein YaiL (DUF2058 family)
MSESLRDQLLKSGIAKAVPKKAPAPRPAAKVRDNKPSHKPPAKEGEIDLARAYGLRAQEEARERQRAQREAEQKARAKKEARRKLQALLDGKALNQADAEQPRNFEFAGKIRRVYVSASQLQQINRGDLGVVMHGGRALVVARDVALHAQAIAPEVVALLVDPSAPMADDGVPDDLMW